MPSVSKSQQRYMGMVHAIQSGKLSPSKVSPKMRETANKMNSTDVEHFAETKRKGLPDHVKKAFEQGFKDRALSSGLSKMEVIKLSNDVGITKEALLGALLPLVESLGGGLGADFLGRQATKAFPAMLAKQKARTALQPFLKGELNPARFSQMQNNAARYSELAEKAKTTALSPIEQNDYNTLSSDHNLHSFLAPHADIPYSPELRNTLSAQLGLNQNTGNINFSDSMKEKAIGAGRYLSRQHNWIPGTVGSMALPMVLSPINSMLSKNSPDQSQDAGNPNQGMPQYPTY